VGDKLISVVIPHVRLRDALDGGLEELCIGSFAVLLGEVECRRGDKNEGESLRLRHLEVILAIYISLADKVSVSGLFGILLNLYLLLTRFFSPSRFKRNG
jgi:hypothetical protein